MKLRYLLLIVVIVLASTFLVQTDVTPEGETETKTVQMGWPLPWLETRSTANGTAYIVLWSNLLLNVAVYGVLLLLIFS